MGYRTIVVGTDGSATAYRAQQKAVRFARTVGAHLIAIGDVGMGKARRLRLGGVAERAAHSAPCDVLIVRTRRRVRKTADKRVYHRIVVGTDGSSTASEAVRKAFDLGMMF